MSNRSPSADARPALFIDRDGTINRDCPYCHDVADLYVYEDAVDLIKRYREKGYLIIIVTNQSGVGRKLFTEKELGNFNSALVEEIREMGGDVDAIYYCPHTPEEGCSCRKPKTGLIEQAEADFAIDMSSSLIVGDREDIDGDLARILGLKFVHVRR